MNSRLALLSLSFIAVLGLSIFTATNQKAEALSAVSLITKGAVGATNANKFQRTYENNTNSLIFLDTNGGQFTQSKFKIANGAISTATSTTITGYTPLGYSYPSSPVVTSTDNNYYMNQNVAVNSIQMYSASWKDAGEFISSTSVLANKQIDTMSVWLKRVGNPGGSVTVNVWDQNWNLVANLGTMAVSSIATAVETEYVFSFTARTLLANQIIGIEYTGSSGTADYIFTYYWASDVFDSTNSYTKIRNNANANTDITNGDMTMRLYKSNYHVGTFAVDNDVTTYWRTTTTGTQSIYADTGATTNKISGIELRHDSSGFIPTSIDVYVSNSTVSWGSVVSTLTLSATTGSYVTYSSTLKMGQYVKLQVNNWGSAGKWQLTEWQVNLEKAFTSNNNAYVSAIETDNTAFGVSSGTVSGYAMYNKFNVNTMASSSQSLVSVGTGIIPLGIEQSKTKIYTAFYDPTGTTLKIGIMNRDFTGFTIVTTGISDINTTFKPQIVVYDGSPDTIYIFYYVATNILKIIKYDGTVSVLGTTISSNSDFSVFPLVDKILVISSSGTWQLLIATGEISQLYTVVFPLKQMQTFDLDTSIRAFKSYPIDLMTATTKNGATKYYPNSGQNATSAPIIQTVNVVTATLTAYNPTKYYYFSQNSYLADATATTWTIKKVGERNAIRITPYSERLNVPLTANYTLLSQNVIKLVCDTSYNVIYSAFDVGDISDCSAYRVLASSSDSTGREYVPFNQVVDLIHSKPYVTYSFNLQSTNPAVFYLESILQGKKIDSAYFDSGGTLAQKYLYGQCYTINIKDRNSDAIAITGTACANDFTTKTINLFDVNIPEVLNKPLWDYKISRNQTNTNNNIIKLNITRQAVETNAPMNVTAKVYITNHFLDQYVKPPFPIWQNFTNVPIAKVNLNNVMSNQTIYFTVYDENDKVVINTVSSGNFLNLNIPLNLGTFFGVPLPVFFIVAMGAIFTRSNAYFGLIAVGATTALLTIFGMLALSSALWTAIIVMIAIGVFSARRYF